MNIARTISDALADLLAFVEAYDEWDDSSECFNCGGPHYWKMREIRQRLKDKYKREHNGPQDNP